MGMSVDLSISNLVILGFLLTVFRKVWKLYQTWKTEEMLDKWTNTPKDKVILHGLPRGKTVPSISPFALKLETYLKIAKIPYQFDVSDPFGPKGKTPWITYNGQHLTDSQLIIQFLNRKFNVDLNTHLTPEQREICRSLRVVLENHFLFGLISWRWLDNLGDIGEIQSFPMWLRLLMTLRKGHFRSLLEGQGLGLHTTADRIQMTSQDLHAVSKILGRKKFLGGDSVCEEDCAVFGMLAQGLWAAPGSPYQKLIQGELANLQKYCERMRDEFWPDWNRCLSYK